MGLFKSSPKPLPVPMPHCQVHLDPPLNKVYKPDDNVTGIVTVSTPNEISPRAVEITLWGQSEVWIRKETTTNSGNSSSTDYYHYRDHAPLFHVTLNLLEKPQQLLPGQTYQYPFNIRVPKGTGFDRSNCYDKPTDAIFVPGPHDLPPTFLYAKYGSYDKNGAEMRPDNCSIKYGVTARLDCPGLPMPVGSDPSSLSSTTPVLFQPINPYAHVQNPNRVMVEKSFNLQSTALAGVEASSIGFRQRLQDRFSSGTPKVDFVLGVESPNILVSGSEFSFRTTFKVLQRADNVIAIPPVTFRVLKLELLEFTLFRAPRDWAANNFRSGEPSKYRDGTPRGGHHAKDEMVVMEEKTLLNSLPAQQTVELPEVMRVGEKKGTEQAGQCEAWFKGRLPGYTTPSFQSFAITRSYRVKVKLAADLGGKTFELGAEGSEVHVGSV